MKTLERFQVGRMQLSDEHTYPWQSVKGPKTTNMPKQVQLLFWLSRCIIAPDDDVCNFSCLRKVVEKWNHSFQEERNSNRFSLTRPKSMTQQSLKLKDKRQSRNKNRRSALSGLEGYAKTTDQRSLTEDILRTTPQRAKKRGNLARNVEGDITLLHAIEDIISREVREMCKLLFINSNAGKTVKLNHSSKHQRHYRKRNIQDDHYVSILDILLSLLDKAINKDTIKGRVSRVGRKPRTTERLENSSDYRTKQEDCTIKDRTQSANSEINVVSHTESNKMRAMEEAVSEDLSIKKTAYSCNRDELPESQDDVGTEHFDLRLGSVDARLHVSETLSKDDDDITNYKEMTEEESSSKDNSCHGNTETEKVNNKSLVPMTNISFSEERTLDGSPQTAEGGKNIVTFPKDKDVAHSTGILPRESSMALRSKILQPDELVPGETIERVISDVQDQDEKSLIKTITAGSDKTVLPIYDVCGCPLFTDCKMQKFPSKLPLVTVDRLWRRRPEDLLFGLLGPQFASSVSVQPDQRMRNLIAFPLTSNRHHPPEEVMGIPWDEFERETMRTASFEFYPVYAAKSGKLLAESGFVYIGNEKSDKVICFFCYAVKENWRADDDIEEVHRFLSPTCPMMTIIASNNVATTNAGAAATSSATVSSISSDAKQQQTLGATAPNYENSRSKETIHENHHPIINSQVYAIPRTPVAPSSKEASQSSGNTTMSTNHNGSSHGQMRQQMNYRDLGIFHERPKHPQYAIHLHRVMSFDYWPQSHHLKPEDLAKAGFFHAGYSDCCRCFFCGGGLRKWAPQDDPLVEHARWYPKCGYIRQYMGETFIQAVKEVVHEGGTITHDRVKKHMEESGSAVYYETDEMAVEEDPAVKSFVDEMYDREEVYSVARDLRREGISLSTEAIFTRLHETQTHTPAATNGATGRSSVNTTGPEHTAHNGNIQHLKEANYGLRNNLRCKICMDKEVKMVFLPCGHLVACQECAVALQDCPVCRRHIRATVKASIR